MNRLIATLTSDYFLGGTNAGNQQKPAIDYISKLMAGINVPPQDM